MGFLDHSEDSESDGGATGLGRVRVIYDAVTPRGDSEIVEAYRDFSSSN